MVKHPLGSSHIFLHGLDRRVTHAVHKKVTVCSLDQLIVFGSLYCENWDLSVSIFHDFEQRQIRIVSDAWADLNKLADVPVGSLSVDEYDVLVVSHEDKGHLSRVEVRSNLSTDNSCLRGPCQFSDFVLECSCINVDMVILGWLVLKRNDNVSFSNQTVDYFSLSKYLLYFK